MAKEFEEKKTTEKLNKTPINDDLYESIFEDVDIPDIVEIDLDDDDDDDDDDNIAVMNIAFNDQNYIYKRVLSPQLKENEILKRTHKQDLMKNIFNFLNFQFKMTYIFVISIILIVAFSNIILGLDNDIIEGLLSFIQYYITAIVAELIAILYFIVKNVFDTSIVELFKNFDSESKNNMINDTSKKDKQ